MSEKKTPVVTALSETMKNPRPLTTEERNKLLSEWADRTLNELLGYSLIIPGFQEKLYSSVIDHFSTDDDLTYQMLKKIQGLREGKIGRPPEWGYARYHHLLLFYSIERKLKKTPAKEVLKKLARMEGEVHTDNSNIEESANKIKKRITKAKKIVDIKEIEQSISRLSGIQ